MKRQMNLPTHAGKPPVDGAIIGELRIAFLKKILRGVPIVEGFYYWIREIGLEKQEVKMDFKVDVRNANGRLDADLEKEKNKS